MKTRKKEHIWKGIWGLYRSIRIPWHLYVLEAVLGVASAWIGLMYVPVSTEIQMGNLENSGLVLEYAAMSIVVLLADTMQRIPSVCSGRLVPYRLRDQLIGHAFRLPMRSFERNATQLSSWITKDCDYANNIPVALLGFITGLSSFFMSISRLSDVPAIEPSLIVTVAALIVGYVLVGSFIRGKLNFLAGRRGRRADAELTAYLSEHLSYFTQIRQLNSCREELRRSQTATQRYFGAQVYQALLQLGSSLISGLANDLITILVYGLGVPMVNRGLLALTDLVLVQSYLGTAYRAVLTIPQLYVTMNSHSGSLYYTANLLAEPEEVYERRRSMDVEDQDIVFDHVSFGYGETLVVKDASFTIPKGKLTVVVGPNGSGKTTLFKLIDRFYTPDSGKISFGPYAAEDIHLKEWRQSFADVLQDPQLFDGTIRENIVYGMSRPVTDEEVAEAVRLAGAEKFIRELPGEYDFSIGVNGVRLSAGQRQRLAIARAVMLDPAYLLLDEATCNMDFRAEEEVTAAMLRLMEGRTTVMISHNTEMLKRADHVIVLNNGTVEASGTREEAEKQSPAFQRLLSADAGPERSGVHSAH